MPEIPAGCTYISDYIDLESERSLIQAIDSAPWDHSLKRRTQHYGYRYDYHRRAASLATDAAPLPAWSQFILEKVQQTVTAQRPADQMIVNEYQSGQGIAPHIDCLNSFSEPVISLSLLSGLEMEFVYGQRRLRTWLAPRSALFLTGPARSRWTHAIRPRKSDFVAGQRRARSRRVSITLRWLADRD